MANTKVDIKNIERPLDFLNQRKGHEVLVKLNSGKDIAGTLVAFDIHINLVVVAHGEPGFIRGDNVVFIS